MKSNSVKQVQLQIHRELNEVTPAPAVDLKQYNSRARDTRLHRIVSSKMHRMRSGTRFIY